MYITQHLQGLDEHFARLDRMADAIVPAAGAALFEEGERIMADSVENYVPVDEGVLKASGVVLPPSLAGGEASVTMGFGGAATAYAEVQHENETFHHDVGEAKYLEQPLLAALPGMPDRLGARLAERLARVAGKS